jgi:lysophospholipase L1-like esterase
MNAFFLAASVLLLMSIGIWVLVLFQMQRPQFWEFQVRKFESSIPAQGGIVFTGSSSIRFWKTLARDMAPLPVINRGFGGAHVSHLTHYAERIIVPCAPKAVVVYAGENDLGWTSRKKPEAVLEDFRHFVELVQAGLKVPRVYFISIKLSPSRRGRWDAIKRVNTLVEDFARARSGVTFIEVTRAMLDGTGEPRRELLRWDRFHLSGQGYSLWTSIIKPVLEHDFQTAPTPLRPMVAPRRQ